MNENSCSLTVTALITTHNREELLRRAVNSVLSQDYDALDLLVVDDASTDGTERYMTKLAAADSRVKYIRISPEETKGSNHARNLGIRAAAGEIVAFLDDDDVWLPGKISAQAAFLQQHPKAGAVSCDWYDVHCFSSKEYRYRHGMHFNKGKNEFFITSYLSVTSGIAVRRVILEAIGGFDEQMPAKQEYELSCRIAMACGIGLIKKPLFEYYHYESGSCISGSAKKHITAQRLFTEKHAGRLAQLTPDQKKRFEGFMAKDLAYRYLMTGDRENYRKTMKPVLSGFGMKEKGVYLLSGLLGYGRMIRIKAMLRAFRGRLGG